MIMRHATLADLPGNFSVPQRRRVSRALHAPSLHLQVVKIVCTIARRFTQLLWVAILSIYYSQLPHSRDTQSRTHSGGVHVQVYIPYNFRKAVVSNSCTLSLLCTESKDSTCVQEDWLSLFPICIGLLLCTQRNSRCPTYRSIGNNQLIGWC